MAKKKYDREPVDWITINGNRVPVFEDGSLGSFMTNKDAKKALSVTAKKSINPKEIARAQEAVKASKVEDDYPSEQEMRDYIKSKGKEKFVKELSNDTEEGYKEALRNVYDQETLTPEEYGKKYFGKDYEYKGDKKSLSDHSEEEKKEAAVKNWEPLSKEEDEVLKKYFRSPEGAWAKDLANDQLKNGEDWDKVMRQAYGVASKYVKPESSLKVGDKEISVNKTSNSDEKRGIIRNDDGTINRKKMNIPKDIPDYKNLDSMDKDEIKSLYSTKSGAWATFPAMERQIEEVAKSTDKRSNDNSLRRQFNRHIETVRDSAYSLDNEKAAAWLNKQADEYEKRFDEALKKRGKLK